MNISSVFDVGIGLKLDGAPVIAGRETEVKRMLGLMCAQMSMRSWPAARESGTVAGCTHRRK